MTLFVTLTIVRILLSWRAARTYGKSLVANVLAEEAGG